MKLGLSVKSQSVETSGITKDYKEALCEFIWNGFEANATHVDLSFTQNENGGITEVIIRDNGDGIDYSSLKDTFGAFLASQKRGLSLQLKSKVNKGKGRFSFLAFATGARWETVCKGENGNLTYTIDLDNVNLSEFDVSDPIETSNPTGTVVSIYGISSLTSGDVSYDALESDMLKVFAWYLYLNQHKKISLVVDGKELDYSPYINADMSFTKTVIIEEMPFTITLIVWTERIKENFCTYYIDDNGAVSGKDTTTFNRNTVGYYHSVYVQSPFFNSKSGVTLTETADEENAQIAVEQLEEEKTFLRKLKREIQEIISKSLTEHVASQAEKAVNAMISRNSFPSFGDDVYSQLRKKDLITVTKELYRLNSGIFYKLKPVQEKSFIGLLNLLLTSEERENVLTILEGIMELSPEQRANFAQILKRTRLENVVAAIKFIEDRYAVIEALKAIVYDYTDYSNERDNVQKIIEQHYWLFGEQYHLVTADQRMKKALQEYLNVLYGEKAPKAELTPDEQEMRRMDIFACGTRVTEDTHENAIEENLIVELKAPGITLTKKVLRQIEDYMDYIRKQPQFNSQHRRWKFISVCNKVDDDVKSRYVAMGSYGKKGLTMKIENYEVYALTWDDVFKSFDLSHGFVLDKLKIDRDAIAEEMKKDAAAKTDSPEEISDNLTKAVTGIA